MQTLLKISLVLAAACMVLFLGCERAPDPEKVLARARKYYRQGQYEKALQDHIWFHENALTHKPSLYGVRLSFALIDWIELGRKYPKAHNALIDLRNRKADLLRNRQGTPELFHDVKSINKYLYESQKTVELYKEMTDCDFDLAKQCYDLAKDELIAHGEFTLCNRMMAAPLFIVRDMRKMLDQNIQIYRSSQWADKAHLDWSISHYLQEAEQTVIVLAENDRLVEAKRFLAEADDKIDIARIRTGIADLENKYITAQSPD